ncbi:hypothetical protein F4802DRAFT_576357 [Xylaria palmicola]|nr:hypothetical protein F4802DRAFT_576357 [Xylaria palmicola]
MMGLAAGVFPSLDLFFLSSFFLGECRLLIMLCYATQTQAKRDEPSSLATQSTQRHANNTFHGTPNAGSADSRPIRQLSDERGSCFEAAITSFVASYYK